MISQSQSQMMSSIQRRVQEIIANELRAEQAIAEDLPPVEQNQGVDTGGGQPSSGKDRSELGIHPLIKLVE